MKQEEDKIVPSVGNDKLQPFTLPPSIKFDPPKTEKTPSPAIVKTPTLQVQFKNGVGLIKKENGLNAVQQTGLPKTLKRYGKIEPSPVNQNIKNSSFGRSVAWSLNAGYSSMWKNTSRMASVAMGDGNPNIGRIGLYQLPTSFHGITMAGLSFDGAVPLVPTHAGGTAMSSTFHLMQDEDIK